MKTISDENRGPKPRHDRSAADREYTIRRFQDEDTAPYLDLYEEVFGSHVDRTWFDWKYRNNPFIDHVPIFVATSGGNLVGARSFFALPVRLDGEKIMALQPCDTMVRAEHRRRGVFTRLTERAIEFYRDRVPQLCFNFPNEKSLPGNLKVGWRVVANKTVWYRIQNPGAVARGVTDRWPIRFASRLVSPIASGYLATREYLDNGDRTVGTVERCTSLPSDRLSSLYVDDAPTGIHVPRDSRFLKWRYRNPRWTYRTYILRSEENDVAAIVTGTREANGITKTKLVDFLAATSTKTNAAARLLPIVLDDHRASDLIASLSDSVPPAALRRRGFLPDSRPPLDRLTATTTLVTRSLSGDGSGDVNGVSIGDAASWSLAFAEQDRS